MDDIKKRIVSFINDDNYKPMTLTEIGIALGLENSQEIMNVMRELI